jgi:predicted RND superfamily exporter protein
MRSLTSGLVGGIILGLVFALLAQQFGFISLSGIISAIQNLAIGAVVGGVVGALVGWLLGRRYLANHPPIAESPAST